MSDGVKVRTCLWFDGDGHKAAEFYVSLLPDSRVENEICPEPEDPPLTLEFTLGGAPYMILNGGPHFKPSPAASIVVLTEDQAETDRLWDALVADGGAEGRCGWLTDRFGVSWQIVPRAIPALMRSEDRAGAQRVQEAVMAMDKLEVYVAEAAFRRAEG